MPALHGSHALVTGASSGIGQALASELSRRKVRVSIAARRSDELAQLVDAIRLKGGEAQAFTVDLSQPGAARDLAQRVQEQVGDIDLLVNNAGVSGGVSLFADKTPEELRRTAEVNFVAPMELAHAVLPGMLQRRHGSIVSVSSINAFMVLPKTSTYVATKRALTAIDEVLRIETAGMGVHVMTVFPGPVDTPMLRSTMAADDRAAQMAKLPVGTVEELARRICRGVEREQDMLVYPQSYALSRWVGPMLGLTLKRLAVPLRLNR